MSGIKGSRSIDVKVLRERKIENVKNVIKNVNFNLLSEAIGFMYKFQLRVNTVKPMYRIQYCVHVYVRETRTRSAHSDL